MINNVAFQSKLNHCGKIQIPFVFAIDFSGQNFLHYPLDDLPKDLAYSFDGITYTNTSSIQSLSSSKPSPKLIKFPIDFEIYAKQFNQVQHHLRQGDTYLLNLTISTPITLNATLQDIFCHSKAKFKFWLKDNFLSFSPERFVQTQDNRLHTYPIKGTIRGNTQDAAHYLLQNPKEKAEHTMVVDLMRNDLGMIGNDVRVHSFRDIEHLQTREGDLLQTSSHISTALPLNWHEHIGTILCQLLPAGSITGTPKHKTTQLISQIEMHHRGYFCGIAGLFDGNNLDTCVLIRYIEQDELTKTLIYKSGGGITLDSDPWNEYQEVIDKVYLPHALL